MTFDEALPRVIELLERQGWASHRMLRRRFRLDEATLSALTTELVVNQQLAVEEEGGKLVWGGELRPRATSAWQPTDELPAAPTVFPPLDDVGRHRSPSRQLTSLVGREQEVAFLLAHWGHVQAGQGQVVLLRGEAGIGKSRLAQRIKAHVADTPYLRWECRCAPEAQHSAFYPIIDLFQREFHYQPVETPEEKLQKMEAALLPYDVKPVRSGAAVGRFVVDLAR